MSKQPVWLFLLLPFFIGIVLYLIWKKPQPATNDTGGSTGATTITQPTYWEPVKNRIGDDHTWSARIFDAMYGLPSGTTPIDYNGPVNNNAVYLTGKNTLDQNTADILCENPHYWKCVRGTPVEQEQVINAGLCSCSSGLSTNFNR